MKFLHGKIPLRLALTTPFVALTVLSVGLAGYVSFRNGRQAVNDVADQVRAEISQRIQDRLGSFLKAPHHFLDISSVQDAWGLDWLVGALIMPSIQPLRSFLPHEGGAVSP